MPVSGYSPQTGQPIYGSAPVQSGQPIYGNAYSDLTASGALPAASAVNTQNLNFLAQGIPNYNALMATQSGNIGQLLAPTDFSDQQRRGAEAAVGSGTAGSGFADINTLHMTEDEKLRRQMLGSQMLSGAIGTLPNPANPAQFLNRNASSAGGPPMPFRTGPAPGSPAPGRVGQSMDSGQTTAVAPGYSPTQGGGGAMDILNQIIGQYAPTPPYAMRSGEAPGAVDGGLWNTEGGQAVDSFGEPIDYSPVYTGDESQG